jgi:hypothetical protein
MTSPYLELSIVKISLFVANQLVGIFVVVHRLQTFSHLGTRKQSCAEGKRNSICNVPFFSAHCSWVHVGGVVHWACCYNNSSSSSSRMFCCPKKCKHLQIPISAKVLRQVHACTYHALFGRYQCTSLTRFGALCWWRDGHGEGCISAR